MYSREKRMKAIELYIKYDRCSSDVVAELGYPERTSLLKWYREFRLSQETGVVLEWNHRMCTYTPEQQRAAVDYYLEHGRSLSRTVRAMGYPSKTTLWNWCEQLAPEQRKRRRSVVQFTQEQKKEAVIALCLRRNNAQQVAEAAGTTRATLYKWKRALLGKEDVRDMTDKGNRDLPNDRDLLIGEISALKQQIRRLQLERDILEGTAELIKKIRAPIRPAWQTRKRQC